MWTEAGLSLGLRIVGREPSLHRMNSFLRISDKHGSSERGSSLASSTVFFLPLRVRVPGTHLQRGLVDVPVPVTPAGLWS